VPVLGVVFNGYMMITLGKWNWIRLIGWLAIGLLVYFFYSRHNSKVQHALLAKEGYADPSA
jgi:APA family basic amino acid/polyamine antiporter